MRKNYENQYRTRTSSETTRKNKYMTLQQMHEANIGGKHID